MYDIIVDPGRNDCTLWIGKNVTTIKGGSILEICREIADRVMLWTNTSTGGKRIQTRSVGVHVDGWGRMYIDCLNSMYVVTHDVIPKHPDIILPKLQ